MTPNVVWIQSDEHRPDSLGCYGSSWAKTPNLDALAKRGTLFTTAVCQSPVCVPSRASQLTARYPQEINTLHNDVCEEAMRIAGDVDFDILPPGTVTFPEWLASRGGFQTVTFGKSHIPPWRPWQAERLVVNDERYAGYYSLNESFDEEEHHVVKRPGGASIILAGTYPGGLDNPSRAITDEAIDWLAHGRDRRRPFLLRVSHNWPHTPVLPPAPFDQLYDPADLPVRTFDEQAYKTRSSWDRHMADAHRVWELDDRQLRQVWKDYMGLCAYVDDEVGRLLAALEDQRLGDSTVVLFSSDHGKSLGEWGATEKGFFDSEVWRVPFIWSWPGVIPQGETRSEPCELIDTGRTLTGLLGLDSPANWRGRDLFASVDDRGEAFGQIGWPSADVPRGPRRRDDHWNCLRVAIRTERYRMDETWMAAGRRVPFELGDGNLFDLVVDPQERCNLWGSPDKAAVVAELRERIERWWCTLDRPARTFGAQR